MNKFNLNDKVQFVKKKALENEMPSINEFFNKSGTIVEIYDDNISYGVLINGKTIRLYDEELKLSSIDRGQISDGYHTFDELYYHRMVLFSVICNKDKQISWKSKLHDDETMYDGYFICGINTPQGQFTYHYKLEDWDKFDVSIIEKAPVWDGHDSNDIIRLLSLI